MGFWYLYPDQKEKGRRGESLKYAGAGPNYCHTAFDEQGSEHQNRVSIPNASIILSFPLIKLVNNGKV